MTKEISTQRGFDEFPLIYHLFFILTNRIIIRNSYLRCSTKTRGQWISYAQVNVINTFRESIRQHRVRFVQLETGSLLYLIQWSTNVGHYEETGINQTPYSLYNYGWEMIIVRLRVKYNLREDILSNINRKWKCFLEKWQ